jgi:hypothetical protein
MKFLTSLLLATLVLPVLPAQAAESKAVATQMAMRDLWVDHIFWVRSVVVSAAAKDKKAQAEAEKQVVADAKKIAGAVEPFYGKAASEKLFGLLAGHYGAIKDYMNATLPSPNAGKQKAASDKLTANANEIAEFLSGANPNWPKGTLIGLLAAHGGHHVTQINQFQKKDYANEAQTWDAMKQHIYILADALTSGIAKQFPDKF